jgi:hypothetical protein
MDLSNPQDRDLLCKHIQENVPDDAPLMAYLEDYVCMFICIVLRTVYQGGLISIPTPDNIQHGVHLTSLLALTSKLIQLERFPGFSKLLAGFGNPTQFNATAFEVQVAAWCASRKLTQSLELSPDVQVGDRVKHPEFLWKTALGDIFCECKQENSADNKANRRITRLFNVADTIYESNGPWGETCRLDVVVQHPAKDGTPRIINRVISEIAARHKAGALEGQIIDGVVSVRLSRTTDPLPAIDGCLQIHKKVLKAHCPEPALSPNAKLTVTMSVMGHRLKQLVALVKDARTQLPPNKPGAIFIDIGGSKIFVDKLNELLAHLAYANTPWISLWERGQPLKAVIRSGQPLDHRLAE